MAKAETLGKKGGNLSANIKDNKTNISNFARWGDNYAYHIGDLSAAVLPRHDPEKIAPKYNSWAESLFKEHPTDTPVLK